MFYFFIFMYKFCLESIQPLMLVKYTMPRIMVSCPLPSSLFWTICFCCKLLHAKIPLKISWVFGILKFFYCQSPSFVHCNFYSFNRISLIFEASTLQFSGLYSFINSLWSLKTFLNVWIVSRRIFKFWTKIDAHLSICLCKCDGHTVHILTQDIHLYSCSHTFMVYTYAQKGPLWLAAKCSLDIDNGWILYRQTMNTCVWSFYWLYTIMNISVMWYFRSIFVILLIKNIQYIIF